MRRLVLAIGLAALLALAGCSAPLAEVESAPANGTDQLGRENGYTYDQSLAIDNSDGLNESEREAVVGRAMARVEHIRRLEFETSVDITVITRGNFSGTGGGVSNASLRVFDNVKFEAAFLVGEETDSIAAQQATSNQTVAGYYDSETNDIVIVAPTANPQLSGERTLAHELVHALQDQHFNLSLRAAETRDGVNARLGLVEGDASLVEKEYMDRCGKEWSCLQPPKSENESSGDSSSGNSLNYGPYLLKFFPYSDGPTFVAHLRKGDDWSAVNAAYDDPPTSAQEIIEPSTYGSFQAHDVSLTDRTRNGWKRVRPAGRPDYGTFGRSGLGAMFARTIYDDYNDTMLVGPRTFINVERGGVNMTDPLNYDLPATRGWQGDRLHVYQRGSETGYVWRLVWNSSGSARRFADAYRALLSHWGGDRVADGVWVVDDGPFEDAYRLTVEGKRVTITNAPTRAALSEVRAS